MAVVAAFATVLLLTIAVSPSHATLYTVGDSDGWALGVNYTVWASGKTFLVNDTLEFVFDPSLHDVLIVSEPDYETCSTANPSNTITGSSFNVTLGGAGDIYFICGTEGHCPAGMKLAVTVSPAGVAPAKPPPAPSVVPPPFVVPEPTMPPPAGAPPPRAGAPPPRAGAPPPSAGSPPPRAGAPPPRSAGAPPPSSPPSSSPTPSSPPSLSPPSSGPTPPPPPPGGAAAGGDAYRAVAFAAAAIVGALSVLVA